MSIYHVNLTGQIQKQKHLSANYPVQLIPKVQITILLYKRISIIVWIETYTYLLLPPDN